MKFGFREVIFLIVMLGVMGAFHFLYLNQRNMRRAAREAEVDKRLHALAELERATATVKDVDLKIAELQQATAFFESKLPQAKEMDKVLREVWSLAEDNRLQTRTVKTLKAQKMTGYMEQPIEMSLSGDFGGFYEFILQLEKLPRLTRVTQMNVSKIQTLDGQMEAKLTLSIFFDPEMGDAGGKAATASAR
jgi:type IV pilus assembly protein PilO